MDKALIVTTVASMVYQFLIPNIILLQDMGYTVEVASNFENGSTCSDEKVDFLKKRLASLNVTCHQIDFSRSPLSRATVKAYKQIRNVIENGKYSIVHCHTPVAAMCTRLACRKARKQGTKVFYTAHGFHFYKGAPLKNWLLYYPVEKYCARFTDVLITINKEDYELAQKKLKAKRVEYVPGVGVDLTKFGQATVNKTEKRKELGVPEDAILLLSVGELNKNKNHETVIRAVAELPETNVYYFIAGKGDLREHLQSVIDEAGLTERVKLLGYRSDVAELHRAADVYVLPSVREGLNVSVMEAMAGSLPCVVSKIRGNTDLIDENGGALFDPLGVENCKRAIESVFTRKKEDLGRYNREKIEKMSVEEINARLRAFYSESK
mgnify:FL=1